MQRNNEHDVYLRFQEKLSKDNFKIITGDKWKTNLLIRHFDIVIYFKSRPHVIIEVKDNLSNKNQLAIGTDQVRSAIQLTNARYGVVTDNSLFYFYDRSKQIDDFYQLEFRSIIEEIDNPSRPDFGSDQINTIKKIFNTAAYEILPENSNLKDTLKENDLAEHIEFNSELNSFAFKETKNFKSDIENKIFIAILGRFILNKICRYSSFDSIFSMINNTSFRLNGIAGMNDKTEINYVDSKLGKAERQLNLMTKDKVKDLNKRFITSCSNIKQKDDLTFWRLYGDDGKGVCMIFKVKKENIGKYVLIQEVNYGQSANQHLEIEFIKEIIEKVEESSGFKFEFKTLDIWKHFFKPFEYRIEEEVRLLIIDEKNIKCQNKGWVKTYSHSILNPFLDFKLNDINFPLELEEIILGPKCLEQELNSLQLGEMINQKSIGKPEIKNINVEVSKIEHYR